MTATTAAIRARAENQMKWNELNRARARAREWEEEEERKSGFKRRNVKWKSHHILFIAFEYQHKIKICGNNSFFKITHIFLSYSPRDDKWL